MLGKLLKYDLKWIYKGLAVFYLLALLFSGLGRLLLLPSNSLLFTIVGKITNGIAIAMMFNALINCFMRCWVRFVRHLYKDESYLTHTLPVTKGEVYLSKVLSAVIVSFTTILVILGCLFICYYSKSNIEFVKSFLELAASSYSTTVIKILFMLSLILVLEIIFVILVGYVGIVLGHRSNQHKIVNSIAIGLGFYFVTQTVSLLVVFVGGLLSSDIMNLVKTMESIDVSLVKVFILAAALLYFIYILFYYFLGKKLLEKGVNVD